MTSWFNGLFNAQEELAKKRNQLKIGYVEDYTEILPLGETYFIKEGDDKTKVTTEENSLGNLLNINNNRNNDLANNTPQKPEGYGAVEAKANKVIEKHSMLIKGSERNPMIAKAYLLIGKSLFFQGKYFEALDALNYINKNFPVSKYNDEAKFYSTLADLEGGNYFDGQEKLIKLYDKKDLRKDLRYQVASNYANFLIKNEHFEEAIAPLEKAVLYSRNKQEKARTLFILGQVYSKLGKQIEAGETFTQVYNIKPGFTMEVKAQLAIAANFDSKKNNYIDYRKFILDQSKKGIYQSKKNEFYFAIAEMAYKDGKLDDAVKYSKLALKEPISDGYIRGRTYENYADIEFAKGNYLFANSYYDSAITTYTKESHREKLKEKNNKLSKLVELHYLVQKNDSILKIARMPANEQETYFSTYIKELKEKEEKQLKLDQRKSTEFQLATKSQGFNSNTDNNSNKFYFYNQSQKNNGKTEFQRIWNSRKLQDNWRTSSQNGGTTLEDKEDLLKGKVSTGDPRRFEIAYYLEKIPQNNNELNNLKIERDTAQLALGTGYFDYFNDTKLAAKTLNDLVASPPKDKDVEIQALYQLYRIHKDKDKTLEEKYKNIIVTEHENTIYAGYILNPSKDLTSIESKEALIEYEIAYNLFKEGKYDIIKPLIKQALEKYPTEIIVPKFALLNALAIAKTEPEANFKKALEDIIFTYKDTNEAKHAKNLLDKIKSTNKQDEIEKINETVSNISISE